MSIYLEIEDLNQAFRSLKQPPIIVNEMDLTLAAEKDKLNEILSCRYENDALDIVPSCECGEIRGSYNLGVVCGDCNKPVISITEQDLECSVWIATPAMVTALVNPTVWSILKHLFYFRNDGFSLIDWLTDPHYLPTRKNRILELIPHHWPRSLNFFIENFDEVMNVLYTFPTLRTKPTGASVTLRQDLEQFIAENREKIFCTHLPFPSRIAFITETSGMGRFVDPTMTTAMDAIFTITSIEHSITKIDRRGREHRTVKAMNLLNKYYSDFKENTLGGKPGIYRKHIFGGRASFTARAVITSLSENHRYDELHLPWSLSVQLFKVHLTSKLLRRGHTPNEITRMFFEYTNRYSPLFDALFHELLSEGNRGVTCLLQRNPSLVRASAQRFYITKIKTDTSINSISLSLLSVKGPNADFDSLYCRF